MRTCLGLACAAALLAQQQPASAPVDAAVSGVVKDSVTGKPLSNYNVSTYVNANVAGGALYQTRATRQALSVSDEQGRYRLTGLPPGTYHIAARNAEDFATAKTRVIAVAGRDLEGIDFIMVRSGEISGKVVDENKEPVPNLNVELVSHEYFMGLDGYYIRGLSRTDDRGQYRLGGMEPGRAYYVMAEKRPAATARSDAPLDAKVRRRTPAGTFYPGTTERESATPITLSPGEHREGIDIELKKSPSYCVEGVAQGPMGPATLRVGFEAAQPSAGTTAAGGLFTGGQILGATAADGRFRFCDLYPGEFRIAAVDRTPGFSEQQPNVSLGLEYITITDRDLKNVRVTAAARQLTGVIQLDGPQPLTPLTTKANVMLIPLLRSGLDGERPSARVDIPGDFNLTGLAPSAYGIRVNVNGTGLYVKDIGYGGRGIRHEPLRFDGVATGNSLTITLGQDGATLTAAVTDKDGNALADATVIAFPVTAITEAALQDSMTKGITDQSGQYTSVALAPGKYYVAATFDAVDETGESLSRVLRARTQFQQIDLGPHGSQSVTLVPIRLR